MTPSIAPVRGSAPEIVRLARGGHLDEVVDGGFCIGCGACAVASGGALTMAFTAIGRYEPVATSSGRRAEPEGFAALCPFGAAAPNEDELAAEAFPEAQHHHEAVGRWRRIYVGHVEADGYRTQGSSGGFTSWVLAQAFASGAIDAVIHVGPRTPDEEDTRLFRYEVSRDPEAMRSRAKSRYYPIEFSEALAQVRSTPGRYAFVGIPCFVKSMRLLMRHDPLVRERVVLCLGLVCGHLKSAALVRSFAYQARLNPDAVTAVNFRLKQPQHRASRYTVDLQVRGGGHAVRDWSRMLDGDWGMGFFQYSACDYCDDVLAETADAASGDAWVEPYTSDGRGTNVVVIRSPLVERLVEEGIASGALQFKAVDGDFAARTQAAGLRQRRQGLAYRLWKMRHRWHPPKRVQPRKDHLSWARRRIYDCRQIISRQSHSVFALAEKVRLPAVYWLWAATMRTAYRRLYRLAEKSSGK